MIRKLLGLLVAAWIGAIGAFGPSHATPAKEAPWLPDAAAYRLTLFLGNLEPIPWDQVETAWSDPYHNSEFSSGARSWLSAKSDIGAEPVLDAIARKRSSGPFRSRDANNRAQNRRGAGPRAQSRTIQPPRSRPYTPRANSTALLQMASRQPTPMQRAKLVVHGWN